MIEWCAYCQRYQGERPPFDRFDLTHGICDACRRSGRARDLQGLEALQPLVDFYRELWADARAGRELAVPGVLERATALGIRPLDLLVGMIQPALCEIGEAWARGEVTVAIEHRFTATVEALVARVRERLPRPSETAARGRLLLVNAEGNMHTLGVRIAEVMLRTAGQRVTAVTSGLPAPEIVRLVREERPALVGISVSLLPQMRSVRELAAALAALDPAVCPRLVVGGRVVKVGLRPADPGGYELIADPARFLALAVS